MHTAQDEDSNTIEAVKAGDVEAYRLLVERHQGKLFGVVFKLVGDPVVAEEIVQEAFVKAYTNLGTFRGEARFGTWLIQIGIHAARDHLRQLKRAKEHHIVSLETLRALHSNQADPPDPSPAANPQIQLGEGEQRDLLQEAMQSLPADYRLVLVLKHYEEWPYERIAELTGDTVGTLKVRAHRGRHLLKDKLIDLGWDFYGRNTFSTKIPADTDEELSS
jgi:RNA polymerase sigma-70 factor (ECF subfamily)